MKYCKKCGEKIENDARYCQKCGTSLRSGGKNNWIIILIAILIVLVACVFMLSSNIKRHNKVDLQQNAISKEERSKLLDSKPSENKQLFTDNLNDKQIAAVAALWAEKNLNGKFSIWEQVFVHPKNSQIVIETIPDDIDLVNSGEGVEYVYLSDNLYSSNKLADKNQSYFYTITNDGNNRIINFYHVRENMQTQTITPVGTVRLDEAVNFINQNHLANEIIKNLNGVQLTDNR